MKLGFYSGSPLLIFEDLEILKPTIMVSVPRIINRVYGKILEDVGKKSAFS
jgi:long-chain acyl-CoA synthetase